MGSYEMVNTGGEEDKLCDDIKEVLVEGTP